MKKLVSVLLCMAMLCSMFGMVMVANAAEIELPDGGKILNSGYSTAYGRTSGGTNGYADVRCSITVTQGGLFTNDSVTALLTSGVRALESIYISATAYYATTTSTEEAADNVSATSVPDAGISLTVYAGNDYLIKGTAGYSINSTTYGNWICGTLIEL